LDSAFSVEKWKRIVSGYGRVMDGWALMESFKEWILGFRIALSFSEPKIGYEEVTIGL